VQDAGGHDPSAVQPAAPAELISFADKQTAAADGQGQPTEPASQNATQQVQPTNAARDGCQTPQQQVLAQDDFIAAPEQCVQPARNDMAPPPALNAPICPIFANIPAELRTLRNWVIWRRMQRPGKKKPDKVPFQTSGSHAKTNDNSTWNTFEACRATYIDGGFDGIGFVFDGKVGDDGLCYTGVDFDDCIVDGILLEPARGRIEQLQTYTERSVSGAGIHSIIRAKPGTTVKHISADKGRSIEVYSGGRFFTFTGVPWGETCGTIKSAVAEVNALIEEGRAEASANASPAGPNGPAKHAEVFVDPAMANQGPAEIFKGKEIERLGEGTRDFWFDKLTPEQKDAAVQYILSGIAANTKVLELGENGGNNDEYFKLITALALCGAPHAEDYFVEHAAKVKNADTETALREKFRTCARNANANKAQADSLEKISVGTLLHYARQAGVDLSARTLGERGWTIKFRDFSVKGKPCPSLANAVIAMKALASKYARTCFTIGPSWSTTAR
jgi:hypothetical protein